jgi:hypothetical protein
LLYLLALGPQASVAGDDTRVTWSVSQPAEKIRHPEDSWVRFIVPTARKAAPAGSPETQPLYLAQSSLQDSSTTYQIDIADMCLCLETETGCRSKPESPTEEKSSACKDSVALPVNGPSGVLLKVRHTFNSHGTFAGSVFFRLGEQSELQSFKLTVYSSSVGLKIAGALCILAGLLLYFGINVLLRRQATIDEALLPAYQLRDSVEVLLQRTRQYENDAKIPLPQLKNELRLLHTSLAPDALKNALPSLVVFPGNTTAGWLDDFKKLITSLSNKATALGVLVDSGVRVAFQVGSSDPTALGQALSDIDNLAPGISRIDDTQLKLSKILQSLENAIRTGPAGAMHPAMAAALQSTQQGLTLPPTTKDLQIRITRQATMVWILVVVISGAVGFYTLVLQNFGFGTAADLFKCFFWGLGFSVAGTQLQQLSQSSVTGAFGINIPKA